MNDERNLKLCDSEGIEHTFYSVMMRNNIALCHIMN
jgi:hypothetical protein